MIVMDELSELSNILIYINSSICFGFIFLEMMYSFVYSFGFDILCQV